MLVVFYRDGDHRDLHVLTHSFPTRRSSDLDQSIVRGKLCKFIGRGCEGQASDRADFPGHVLIKIIWRIKAGSYRRAALRQGMQPGLHVPQALNACFNLRSAEHTSELQSLMRISYAVL